MPRATLNREPIVLELTSCPGGTVTLQRMSYGDWLTRRDMSMAFDMAGSGKKMEGGLKLQNRKVTLFEFQKCVVESNLTDDNDQPLNFHADAIFDIIDPKVAAEIGNKIADMHDFEDDLGN